MCWCVCGAVVWAAERKSWWERVGERVGELPIPELPVWSGTLAASRAELVREREGREERE